MKLTLTQSLALVSVMGMVTIPFPSLKVEAQQAEQLVQQPNCAREPEAYLSPEMLATMAYRGAFQKEGIPGYEVFQTEFEAGNITGQKIVQAAVQGCVLSNEYGMGTHAGYADDVKDQVQLMIRESN